MNSYLIDLYCGIGGTSEGFVKAGYHVALAVDSWKSALDVHKSNHPDAVHLNTILGTQASKGIIFESLNLLKDGHVHIHASPPCQNLSSVNSVRNEQLGIKLTKWTLDLLIEAEKRHPNLTWTIEQVPNNSWINALEKQYKGIFFKVYDMSEYGVCQNRKRLIISNVEIKLKKEPCPSLDTVLTVPKGTHYLANGYVSNLFVAIRDYKKGETIGYTVVSCPAHFLNKSKSLIRKLNIDDMMKLQTLPNMYLSSHHGPLQEKHKMVANCVPPKFAYKIAKAIKSDKA